MQKAYKLQGKHRHYDWGGTHFIPALMGIDNAEKIPYAEYWMGAHPSASSVVYTPDGVNNLDELIEQNPKQYLGDKISATFGSLPYLFKILDVSKMLSIQVHPSIQSAINGYEKEDALGIALDAPNRNYKDKNHKPEVMVALSDFWLLHGFLPPEELEARLQAYLYFHPLQDHFRGVDYQGLYSFYMHLSDEDANRILKPLMMDAVASVQNNLVDQSHPHWWANKYYGGVVPEKGIDKGIFSIYILNIVHIPKYQGVYQGAGLLHAYLEGQNIELMANSDNVLRGGLTSKHIDVDELIQHVQFVPTYPNILRGEVMNEFEVLYPCPVNDFGLTKITIPEGKSYTIKPISLEMILVTEGSIMIDDVRLKAGEVGMLQVGEAVKIEAMANSVLFKSFVP